MNGSSPSVVTEPIITPLDIQMALDEWREINARGKKWATFWVEKFAHNRSVSVCWGDINDNGKKEFKSQTITYHLRISGKVDRYIHDHF